MNFLIVLSLFLASQAVVAKGSLSSLTKNYLRKGDLLKLNVTGAWRADVIREINSSPTLLEEARNIVLAEHGEDKLLYFEHILKVQQVADLLGIEDSGEISLKTFTIAYLINHMAMSSNLATKEYLEKESDEVTEEQRSRVLLKAFFDHPRYLR